MPFRRSSIRRLLALCLLLILIPLKVSAMGLGTVGEPAGMEIEHAMAHASGRAHHHEADGRIHFDRSRESAAHQLDCSIACAIGLESRSPRLLVPDFSYLRPDFERPHLTSIFLEDPDPPPISIVA